MSLGGEERVRRCRPVNLLGRLKLGACGVEGETEGSIGVEMEGGGLKVKSGLKRGAGEEDGGEKWRG